MIETHSTTMNSAHYARMGKEECEKIHLASLEILQRVGVDVHDEKARGYLVRGGRKGGWTACAHPGIYGGTRRFPLLPGASRSTTATVRWQSGPADIARISAAGRTA